jgi:hypothetical protein
MDILIIVAVVGLAILFGALGLWGLSEAIDKTIKDYIDYARKGKDDGSD